ncbi:hypothetical protein ACFQH9_04895 [Pseudonocardia lutea]|uniref:Uncharacterized protein n=1 Tax=Pseudonocardia lutea TaxID=2172015 RepID=A0ABW1I3V1_9PSEU
MRSGRRAQWRLRRMAQLASGVVILRGLRDASWTRDGTAHGAFLRRGP